MEERPKNVEQEHETKIEDLKQVHTERHQEAALNRLRNTKLQIEKRFSS